MLKDKTILRNLLSITVCFISGVFSFYMIGFYMKYVKGDFYLNCILSALATAISIMVTNPV